jgi:hypothetical protein
MIAGRDEKAKCKTASCAFKHQFKLHHTQKCMYTRTHAHKHMHTNTQRDIERYRMLGVPIKIIDHEEEEERKRRDKLAGRVRYIETAEGFNLTEDQFNMYEEWSLSEEAQRYWDAIREYQSVCHT